MRLTEMLVGAVAIIAMFGVITGFFTMQPIEDQVIARNVYKSFGRSNGYKSLDDFLAKGFKIHRQLDDYNLFGARTVEVYYVIPKQGTPPKSTVVFAILALGPAGLVLTSTTVDEPSLEFDAKGKLVFKKGEAETK